MRTMIAIVLVAGAAWVISSASAGTAVQIAHHLRNLDSADFATRARATEDLARIGPPALDALVQYTASARSLEARRRAETLVRDIRYTMFKGGKVVDGVQATLRSDRDVFRSDEAVIFSLEIKNVGTTDVEVYEGLGWGFFQLYKPTNEHVRSWTVPCNANIQLHQLNGEKPEVVRSPIACGPSPRSPIQVLKSNRGAPFPVVLTSMGFLKAGEYEALVSCHSYSLASEGKEALVTNTVKFKVVDKR